MMVSSSPKRVLKAEKVLQRQYFLHRAEESMAHLRKLKKNTKAGSPTSNKEMEKNNRKEEDRSQIL